jgi:nicotinate phosphoribosyltransferase
LSALRRPGEPWRYKVKLSEQAIKISNPGVLQVARFEKDNQFVADMIYNQVDSFPEPATMIDPKDATRVRRFDSSHHRHDVLGPVFEAGSRRSPRVSLDATRAFALEQLGKLYAGIKRFDNPHEYPVGLEQTLFELKTGLIHAARLSA